MRYKIKLICNGEEIGEVYDPTYIGERHMRDVQPIYSLFDNELSPQQFFPSRQVICVETGAVILNNDVISRRYGIDLTELYRAIENYYYNYVPPYYSLNGNAENYLNINTDALDHIKTRLLHELQEFTYDLIVDDIKNEVVFLEGHPLRSRGIRVERSPTTMGFQIIWGNVEFAFREKKVFSKNVIEASMDSDTALFAYGNKIFGYAETLNKKHITSYRSYNFNIEEHHLFCNNVSLFVEDVLSEDDEITFLEDGKPLNLYVLIGERNGLIIEDFLYDSLETATKKLKSPTVSNIDVKLGENYILKNNKIMLPCIEFLWATKDFTPEDTWNRNPWDFKPRKELWRKR